MTYPVGSSPNQPPAPQSYKYENQKPENLENKHAHEIKVASRCMNDVVSQLGYGSWYLDDLYTLKGQLQSAL